MRRAFSLQSTPLATLRRWSVLLSGMDFFTHDEVQQGIWEPTITAPSGSTLSLQKILLSEYELNFRTGLCYIAVEGSVTIATATAAGLYFTLPFPAKYAHMPFATNIYTGSAGEDGSCITYAANSNLATVYRNGAAVWGIGSDRIFRVSGFYRVTGVKLNR